MKKSSRYVFGAGMAAASILPMFDGAAKQADAAAITAAGFTFEGSNMIVSATSALSYSYAGELGGSLTMLHSAGTINSVGGNPGRALTGNQMVGASYTFKFSLDNLDDIAISFDMTGSATGPRDFIVQYSTDGTNFSSFASFALSTMIVQATATSASSATTTTSAFASNSSASAWNISFSAPAAFSDLSTDAGDVGYLQILQSGTAGIASSTIGTGGTNRIDNILITGDAIPTGVVPEPTAALVPLSAAGLLFRRRSQKA